MNKEKINFYCKCGKFLGFERENDFFISSSGVKTKIDYKNGKITVECGRCKAKTLIRK